MYLSMGRAGLSNAAADRLRTMLENPRQRAAVSRILNTESEKLKTICEEVAESDLHRRPDSRRTAESLAHGPEYHDSFEIITARDAGANRLRAGVLNSHPFARAAERGTPAHRINARVEYMRFPWNLQRLGPHDGAGLGDFLVTGTPRVGAKSVNHTGAGAKRIMARARRRYLYQSKRANRR